MLQTNPYTIETINDTWGHDYVLVPDCARQRQAWVARQWLDTPAERAKSRDLYNAWARRKGLPELVVLQ